MVKKAKQAGDLIKDEKDRKYFISDLKSSHAYLIGDDRFSLGPI